MFNTVRSYDALRTSLINGWLPGDAWNYMQGAPHQWWNEDQDKSHWQAIFRTSETTGDGLATRPANLNRPPHW